MFRLSEVLEQEMKDFMAESLFFEIPKIEKGDPKYPQYVMDQLTGTFIYNSNLYCVKCRGVKFVERADLIKMKNGKPAIKAKCPDCGTGMFKIGEK